MALIKARKPAINLLPKRMAKRNSQHRIYVTGKEPLDLILLGGKETLDLSHLF